MKLNNKKSQIKSLQPLGLGLKKHVLTRSLEEVIDSADLIFSFNSVHKSGALTSNSGYVTAAYL